MNRDQAMKATRNGALAAMIAAVVTFVMGLVAMVFDSTEGILGYYNNEYGITMVFLDVILFLALAYGVSKHSRVVSILLLMTFLMGKLYLLGVDGPEFLTPGQPFYVFSITTLIFIYFFAKAVQGSFVYHQIEKRNNPEKYIRKKWYYFLGIPLALIFSIIMIVGLLSVFQIIPTAEVISGEKVSQKHKNVLISNGILNEDEDLLYFYSDGLTSILENSSTGSLLTDNAVVMYTVDETGELKIYEITLGEISSIKQLQDGSFYEDSEYKIHDLTGNWLIVTLSNLENGDTKFIEQLRKMSPQLQ